MDTPSTASPVGDGQIPGGMTAMYSNTSSKRLKTIAHLRAKGISEYVNLPQIVVCGDQSAGKSSVLKDVTEIPFPRQEGICTRFPNEIIVEDTSEENISIEATIIPAPSREEGPRAALAAYRKSLHAFEELPCIIKEAGALMGVRGFSPENALGPAFASDVLRIKVSGPTGIHLTVIDLPGLIQVPDETRFDDDMDTVNALVDSYLENPRSIILAVVQASNDVSNQPIIRKARNYDPEGNRTIGVITKPDLINENSEPRIALLANNKDSAKLKLGWFLTKNPSPKDIERGISFEQRHREEINFFSKHPWNQLELDVNRVGIVALRTFIQSVLDEHIESELPKVRDEIRNILKIKSLQLYELGDERCDVASMRRYVTSLSMHFYNIVISGLDGNYLGSETGFFAVETESKLFLRLRAMVHRLNTEFSNTLREHGQKRKVVLEDSNSSSSQGKQKPQKESEPVSKKEMEDWVKQVYSRTRGKELPGTYNHVLLSELFHEQSSKWKAMTQIHINKVHDQILAFVNAAIRYVVKDDHSLAIISRSIEAPLQRHKTLAEKELEILWEDETQQPITYNHYYTDNIQHKKQDSVRTAVSSAMVDTVKVDYGGGMHISNVVGEVDRLLGYLKKRIIVDMDNQTCLEALEGLHAYYKVARKTWVDNVCKQVIERHLLRRLPNIFSPSAVAGYSDDDLHHIAAETPAHLKKRKDLQLLVRNLEDSLQEL